MNLNLPNPPSFMSSVSSLIHGITQHFVLAGPGRLECQTHPRFFSLQMSDCEERKEAAMLDAGEQDPVIHHHAVHVTGE